jgi:hypothetical protein
VLVLCIAAYYFAAARANLTLLINATAFVLFMSFCHMGSYCSMVVMHSVV